MGFCCTEKNEALQNEQKNTKSNKKSTKNAKQPQPQPPQQYEQQQQQQQQGGRRVSEEKKEEVGILYEKDKVRLSLYLSESKKSVMSLSDSKLGKTETLNFLVRTINDLKEEVKKISVCQTYMQTILINSENKNTAYSSNIERSLKYSSECLQRLHSNQQTCSNFGSGLSGDFHTAANEKKEMLESVAEWEKNSHYTENDYYFQEENVSGQEEEEQKQQGKDNFKLPPKQLPHQTVSGQPTDRSVTTPYDYQYQGPVHEGATEQHIPLKQSHSIISQNSSMSISSKIPTQNLIDIAYDFLKNGQQYEQIHHQNQEIAIQTWLWTNKRIVKIKFELNGFHYKFFAYIKNKQTGDPYMEDLQDILDKYQEDYENNVSSKFIHQRIKGTEDFLSYISVNSTYRKKKTI